MRISDWSSDVCSSDLFDQRLQRGEPGLDERGVPAPLVRAGRGQGVARQRQRVAQLAVPGEARPLAEADDFTLRVRKESVVIKAGPAVGRQRVEVVETDLGGAGTLRGDDALEGLARQLAPPPHQQERPRPEEINYELQI